MILITGGTGNVGRELVRHMAQMERPLRVLVRDPARAASLQLPGVELVRGDFNEPGLLIDALSGIHKAFLLTPPNEHQAAMESNFVDALRQSRVRHVVKLSALGAAIDSPARLLRTHAESERRIEESGIAWTHLRPHQFMQNFLGFRGTIASGNAFYSAMGTGRVGMVDVRDVAAVAAQVLEEHGHERKAYDITGPEALSYSDAASALSEALGRRIDYIDVPPEAMREAMVQHGLSPWLADALVELHALWRDNRVAQVTDAVSAVARRDPKHFRDWAREFAPVFLKP